MSDMSDLVSIECIQAKRNVMADGDGMDFVMSATNGGFLTESNETSLNWI